MRHSGNSLSWIARTFLIPFSLLLYLGLALVFAVLADLLSASDAISMKAMQPSHVRIQLERQQFATTFETPHILFDPRPFASSAQKNLSQLERKIDGFNFSVATNQLPATTLWLKEHLLISMSTFELFTLRVLSLLSLTPLLAGVCIVFGVDGLVRRSVRKAGAGLESARIYHVAKRTVKPLLLWGCFFYLVLPVTLDIRWLNTLLLCTVPILLGIVVSRFKKYV